MANKSYSLAHTKWMCKYHIVFTPKYRRKIIYNKYREDLIEIMRTLCKYKGVEINVGDQIKSNLKANDIIDWQFVSKEKAVNGIKAGKYYAGIEIPKGFSKSLTSIMTKDFKQPQITYYANEKKNAIATKITDKVVQTIQTEVNESFVTTVVNLVNKMLGTVIEEGKKDGTNIFQNLQQTYFALSLKSEYLFPR